MELTLSLMFACCHCQHSITVTLRCKGAGLTEAMEDRLAAVNVPCPTCNQVCQLVFDPLGKTVHEVRRFVPAQRIPEPSMN